MSEKLNQFPLSGMWFLRMALAIGLFYGVIEAAVALVLTHLHGSLTWKTGVSSEALLYSPLFYGATFLALSLPFILFSRMVKRLPWDAMLVWFLAALSGYCLATLLGHWFANFAAIVIALGVGSVAGRWYLHRRDRRALLIGRAAPALVVLVLLVGFGALGLKRYGEYHALAKLPASPPGAPNIIMLVIDTQRGDHLTSYGYQRPTTPRLAQLALGGVVFHWALSPAATTLPSHSSIMTGRRVLEHQAGVGGRLYLDKQYETIAELLRGHGYATGGFVANIFWTGRHTGIDRGFSHYEDYYGTFLDGVARTILGRAVAYTMFPKLGFVDIPGRKNAATINRELLGWIDRKPAKRPFFAFLNYFDMHAPYLPPAGYAGRFSKAGSYKARRIEIGAWNEHSRLPDPAVLQEWRDRYDESLMYLDQEIGELMDSLGARGTLQNTAVILVGDHGESFGDHGMVHHGGSLYLEQIHVPLLMWGPGIPRTAVPIETPIDLRGLPRTIAELAHVNADTFPGRSLLGYLGSAVDSVPAALSEGPYVEGDPKEWQTGRGWVTSVVRGPYHLIALESGSFEVYDYLQDPAELHDLAGDPIGKRVIDQLKGEQHAIVPAPER